MGPACAMAWPKKIDIGRSWCEFYYTTERCPVGFPLLEKYLSCIKRMENCHKRRELFSVTWWTFYFYTKEGFDFVIFCSLLHFTWRLLEGWTIISSCIVGFLFSCFGLIFVYHISDDFLVAIMEMMKLILKTVQIHTFYIENILKYRFEHFSVEQFCSKFLPYGFWSPGRVTI